ncbi:MAG: alpha-2-macroglobulin, partial [Planctomycetota bacterium]
DPKGQRPARIAKYLLNNRKHATYWSSTRDTGLCIEALAEFLEASGEAAASAKLTVLLDGKVVQEAEFTPENLFRIDNTLTLAGDALTSGEHELEIRREGKGPLYFNAYLTNFTREDPIPAAGLEVRVHRKIFRLVREDAEESVAGGHGQVVDQKIEKYRREELSKDSTLESGDLVEVELTIDSKNDYEYLIFEDFKPAGCEPVNLQSGYDGNGLGAYVEYRDEGASFFVQQLARGTHSVKYRMRAEIPGRFSALPTQARAMYAPELRGNSEEAKLTIR